MQHKKVSKYFVAILISLATIYPAENAGGTPVIPSATCQVVLVLTDSIAAVKGSLYTFERKNEETDWELTRREIPAVLGRNGLGWGIGLHDSVNLSDYPPKREGDGKSPAGVFNLSLVFGYETKEKMKDLKMPYLHVNEFTECIDDAASKHYNTIISRDKISEIEKPDWNSSERMRSSGIYYELGVVIDHNTDPVRNSAGSCIFLHNWSDPGETMAGCTAMAPSNMKDIVKWLDADRKPVLIQLTRQSYFELKNKWMLPEIDR